MYTDMDWSATIPRRVLVDGVNTRQILRETGIHSTAVARIPAHGKAPESRWKGLGRGPEDHRFPRADERRKPRPSVTAIPSGVGNHSQRQRVVAELKSAWGVAKAAEWLNWEAVGERFCPSRAEIRTDADRRAAPTASRGAPPTQHNPSETKDLQWQEMVAAVGLEPTTRGL